MWNAHQDGAGWTVGLGYLRKGLKITEGLGRGFDQETIWYPRQETGMESVMPWIGLPRRFFISGPWLLACSGGSLIPSLSERAGPVGSRPFCLPESVAHPPTLNLFVGRLLLMFLSTINITHIIGSRSFWLLDGRSSVQQYLETCSVK